MKLVALPAFADNYIWMLHDSANAIVVDPGETAPVLQALSAQNLTLQGILVTHHHGDHVGGLSELRPHLQGPVFGPAREKIPQPYVPLKEGDTASLLDLRFEVMDVPGHTAGHIAYFLPANRTLDAADALAHPILFCGDTLFSAGCGRLFEGTPTQMLDSLNKLSAKPDDTRVCCAHEYTLSNLKFAHAVEPDNVDVVHRTQWAQAQRAAGSPTVPSTLAVERSINPFLRSRAPGVMAAASARGATSTDALAVFTAIRQWKNDF